MVWLGVLSVIGMLLINKGSDLAEFGVLSSVCATELSKSKREFGLDSLCCILGLHPKYSASCYRDILTDETMMLFCVVF